MGIVNRYPKRRPSLSFTDLERAVKTYEAMDRSDTNSATKANALLHEQYSNELAQRKQAHGRRMADAIKRSGYKG